MPDFDIGCVQWHRQTVSRVAVWRSARAWLSGCSAYGTLRQVAGKSSHRMSHVDFEALDKILTVVEQQLIHLADYVHLRDPKIERWRWDESR